jgi:glycogen phosphorylase
MAVPKPFLPDNRGHLDPALDRRLERLGLADRPGQWTERYLLCEQLADPLEANVREKFEATSRFIRDLIAHRWVMTRRVRAKSDPKRVHYLSMEFLLGRTLRNNIMNLGADAIVRQAMLQQGWNLEALIEEEPDAGLGNGGLGRLAACFIDSLATLQYPAIGYGLRYEYGIFRQLIRNGSQIEMPDNWLFQTDPWEIPRPRKVYVVPLQATFELRGASVNITRNKPSNLLGMAYDRPVIGYGACCVNTRARSLRTSPPNPLHGCCTRTIPPRQAGRCVSCSSISW